MVNALESGLRGEDSSPDRELCLYWELGKTLFSHNDTPPCCLVSSESGAAGDLCDVLGSIPSRVGSGESVILVISCYGNRDKF